ncbi:MAG: glycosidase [Planctomycetota bacterium]
MPPRLFTHKLLSPNDLEPSDPRMRVVGVFNPGVVDVGGRTAILARVVEQPVEARDGFFPSPRYGEGGLCIDWLACDDCDTDDPRTLVSKTTGRVRLRFVSHLRLFWAEHSGPGYAASAAEALRIMPAGPHELYGIEDPRITRIDDTYHITYVGVSPFGVCTMLMQTRDFGTFERQGVMLPPDNKDVLLFPERVGGRYAMLHRPMPSMNFAPPRVWFAQSDDRVSWGGHRPVEGVSMGGAFRDRAGGSTPPILTERGWLVLVHGSDKQPGDGGAGVYSAGAVILDRDEPWHVVARTPEPFMRPEHDFEKRGFVDNVVFPTAAIVRNNRLDVFYGAADGHVGVCGFDLASLESACAPLER